ncbi:MAG TPA: hypothetical protein VIX81_02885 [Gammaproteobacteria bacterium]
MSAATFQPGDVVMHAGETYQVLEDLGGRGRVIPFPADSLAELELAWDQDGEACRRIGHAPLPAPTPCSTDGCCPTQGNPLTEEEVFGRR